MLLSSFRKLKIETDVDVTNIRLYIKSNRLYLVIRRAFLYFLMKNNEIGKTASFGVIHVKPIDKILKEMYLLENNCVYFICLFKKKPLKF